MSQPHSSIELPDPPKQPLGHSPLRRPGSLRRTSTIHATWPEGSHNTHNLLFGRARDLFTPADGSEPLVLAQDDLHVRLWPYRVIEAIDTVPPRPILQQMVGAQTTGKLRRAIAALVPAERAAASPLYLLLDEITGISHLAGMGWLLWVDNAPSKPAKSKSSTSNQEGSQRDMQGVCIGFRAGTTARIFLTSKESGAFCPVPPLLNPDDPLGWHETELMPLNNTLRARRLDIWLSDNRIEIDAMFQDSATAPDGGRLAMHEYGLKATADRATHKLLTVTADPRILPYRECIDAPKNLQRLIGAPLGELRELVLTELKREAGCTHLNDALRALAEVPVLAQRLEMTLDSQSKRSP